VPRWVEGLAGVIAAREAEIREQPRRLVPDRRDPVDDRARVRVSMRERAVEVVQDWQQLPDGIGPGRCPSLLDVPGSLLAQVVRLGQGPQQPIFQRRHTGPQVSSHRLAGFRGFRGIRKLLLAARVLWWLAGGEAIRGRCRRPQLVAVTGISRHGHVTP
jgi:hypothetical protein